MPESRERPAQGAHPTETLHLQSREAPGISKLPSGDPSDLLFPSSPSPSRLRLLAERAHLAQAVKNTWMRSSRKSAREGKATLNQTVPPACLNELDTQTHASQRFKRE